MSGSAKSGIKLLQFPSILLLAIFIILAFLHIILSTITNGYQIDIGWFTNWCINLNELPFKSMYREGFHVNYQPTYLYCFWLIGAIGNTIGTLPGVIVNPWAATLEPFSNGWILTLKSIPILSNFLLAYLAYFMASRTSTRKTGILSTVLILLCPAIMANTLLWGQIDSFLMLLVIASLMLLCFAIHRRENHFWALSAIFYTLAILTKPQAVIFIPIFLSAAIWHFNFKSILIAVISAVITLFIVCLPFAEGNVFSWIFNQISSTAAQYNIIALNAYNTYFLAGLNFKEQVSPVWDFLKTAIPAAITILTIVFWKIKLNKKSSLTEISTIVFFIAFLTGFIVFMFMPAMHERYSYPALICIFFAFAVSGKRRFLPIIAVLSITIAANLIWLLSYLKLGGAEWEWAKAFFVNNQAGAIFSLLNLATMLYSIVITVIILIKPISIKPISVKTGGKPLKRKSMR
jgi:Gpi18-like mannosyltransferase